MLPASTSQFLHSMYTSMGTLPRPKRCLTCSSETMPKKTPRNLVVCIDGTANKFGRNNTNVVKIFGAVDRNTKSPQPEQLTYYSSGIGTRPRVFNVLKRMQMSISDRFDMAIAWNVEEIVKDAYAWLAGKYQEGDQIYLFGFSRGAYQVRILAWMIYEVGLIKNPTVKEIGTAYDHFEAIMSNQPNAHDMAREFRKTFSWENVRVHFIGVWDTVSSVGFGRGDVCLSGSAAAAHACHIRHALALDECRVKFMPEYFLEMNSPDLRNPVDHVNPESTGENGLERFSSPDGTFDRTFDKVETPSSEGSTLESMSSYTGDKAQVDEENSTSPTHSGSHHRLDRRTTDIKEVWFAGVHSDVGGTHRPGKSFHAGNISLAWMRREASTSGLVLKHGHILWTDEDLDLGTTDSMTFFWKLVEFLPVLQQISFSGSGENGHRQHLFEPRRIIPGQKIHASIQFASTYIPKATFGNGFGNPLETADPMPSKDDDIWEKEAFDRTTYAALFDYLSGRQGDTPFYLHKLLFMLRFTEGRSPAMQILSQRKTLVDLINRRTGLERLVAITTYFESLDSTEFEDTFLEDVFVEAKQSLVDFIKPDQPDWPRAAALLRPIAKHEKLRRSILVDDVIDSFLELLDHIIANPQEHFEHVMDALASLVELHPGAIIKRLIQPSEETTQRDRLSIMLGADDPRHLTAVLRAIVLLARQAPFLCLKVKPRLQELAKKQKGPVSLLAVQALVEVSRAEIVHETGSRRLVDGLDPSSSTQLDHLHASTANVSPSRNWMRIGDSLLHQIFSAGPLGNHRIKFIQKLFVAANGRQTRARTAATFTLLQLRQVSNDIESHLQSQGLLDVFIRQLQFKDSALLAAYALTKCLSHEDLAALTNTHPNVVGYIVNMIRLDHFDEAVGVVEGFSILEDLLSCDELKSKILGYDITTLLERKLGAGKPREMRTSLIYLNIFRTHGEHSLTQNLVKRGMSRLRTSRWSTQKSGVAILCSLAKTWFGAEVLKQVIPEVIDMLLPTHHTQPPYTSQSKSPSVLLGPALVMRVLAENETLREEIRQMPRFGRLKHLHLFGDLLGAKETPIWQVRTPTRDDVLDVINQLMKSVDSVEGSTNTGFVLPKIRHWHRIARVLRDGILDAILVPTAVTGVAVLTLLSAIVLAPVVVSRKIVQLMRHPWRLDRQNAIIRSLKLPDSESPSSSS